MNNVFTEREQQFLIKYMMPQIVKYSPSATELQEFGLANDITPNAAHHVFRKIKKKLMDLTSQDGSAPSSPKKVTPKSPSKRRRTKEENEDEDNILQESKGVKLE